jgi:maltose/maltodextrin transport system substrate-binding protein
MIKYWTNLESALKNVASGRQSVDEALDSAAQRTVQ